MLELKQITKSYFGGNHLHQVLNGISISFRKNEFTSILGASGSGKTTLLNIIGGLDQYDTGELIIEGVSTKRYQDENWDSYRNYRVGFIFQSYHLINHQTILSNVEIALTLSGISKKERTKRAKQALEKVGLLEHIYKKPNQLSGGQMQRVAIARALVNNPEIILADEPTGALDSKTSIQIMELLKEIAKEKLVIMVTHNPDLAHLYSTRIIELKDGAIIHDSNPFEPSEEKIKPRKILKTSMPFFTSLELSFQNLLTKKGRTFLTAFAGSIGIMGIAFILSLSNGVSKYVERMERDSFADFPIAFEKNSYDFTKLIEQNQEEETSCSKNTLCSKDDITSSISLITNGFIKKNHLKELKQYLEDNETIKEYTSEIQYSYALDLQIYSNKNDDYVRVNPNSFNLLNIEETSSQIENTPVFEQLLDSEELLNGKYELLAGSFPKEYNELVLIVNSDNSVPDSILYALDIKDRKELTELLKTEDKINRKKETYQYDDILNLSYKLVLNTDYYQYEDGRYQDYSNHKEYMKKIVDNGIDIKVVGILRAKDNTKTSAIGYKHSLTEYVISQISKTDIYKKQVENKDINVITNEPFDGFTNTYEETAKLLGIADMNDPAAIYIYPKNFESKEKIIEQIDNYNQKQKESENNHLIVSYTDLMEAVVNGITSIIGVVSFVLIGFIAISLIVSSIMIAIITYISVLERTKEIGILRAIGASKKDISRVFHAETIIEGLLAGLMGIGIVLLLSIPINIITEVLTKVHNVASLPFGSAIILIALSVLLNVGAGHIPARMASRKNPVTALRTE